MGDRGYLAVDALAGLGVTVLALVIVLQAYAATLTLGRRASAERRAAALSLWVLEAQWPRLGGPGRRHGMESTGWSWSLQSDLVIQSEAPNLCHVRIVVSDGRVKRSFETDKFCRAPR